MKRDKLLLSSLLLCFVVAGCGKTTTDPRAQAKADFKKGSYDAAIAKCDQVLVSDPDDAEILMLRGQAFLNKGANYDAIRDYTEVIRLKPDDPEAYYQRAIAHENDGNPDLAFADQLEARKRDPLFQTAYPFESKNFNIEPVELKTLDPSRPPEQKPETKPNPVEDIYEEAPQALADNETESVDSETIDSETIDLELFGVTTPGDPKEESDGNQPSTIAADIANNIQKDLTNPAMLNIDRVEDPLGERFELDRDDIDDNPLGLNLDNDISDTPEIQNPPVAPVAPPITTALPQNWTVTPGPPTATFPRLPTTGLGAGPANGIPTSGISSSINTPYVTGLGFQTNSPVATPHTLATTATGRIDYNPRGATGLMSPRNVVGVSNGPTLSTSRQPTSTTMHANPIYLPGQTPPPLSTSLPNSGYGAGLAQLPLNGVPAYLGTNSTPGTRLGPGALITPPTIGIPPSGQPNIGTSAVPGSGTNAGPAAPANSTPISTALPDAVLRSRVTP